MSKQGVGVLTWAVLLAGAVNPYRGVGFDGNQVSSAGGKMLGIANRGGVSGEMLDVTVIGTVPCEAGGSFDVGAALCLDSSGRVVAASSLAAAAPVLTPGIGTLAVASGSTAVTSTAANGAVISGAPAVAASAPVLSGGILPQFIIGDALQAASAAGDVVEVLLRR